MNDTTNRKPRYNGPLSYSKTQRKAYIVMRAEFPDVYVCPGLGWCGPGYEQVIERQKQIDEMR